MKELFDICPALGYVLFIFVAAFVWAMIYGSIQEARKREEARVRAQRRVSSQSVKAAWNTSAAARKAREASDKRAAEAIRKMQEDEARAATRETKRKLTASELLPKALTDAKPFAGEKVVFTGTFPRIEHKELIQIVASLGGIGHEAVHAGTTLLVIGPNPGKCKQDRAKHWGIKTITWEEWYSRAFGTDPGPEFTAAV